MCWVYDGCICVKKKRINQHEDQEPFYTPGVQTFQQTVENTKKAMGEKTTSDNTVEIHSIHSSAVK